MKNYLNPARRGIVKLLSLLLFLTLCSASGYAQISTTFINWPDSAYSGNADSVSIQIKNLDIVTYSGYINIFYSTDTVAFTPVQLCSIPSITLAPNATAATTCLVNFDSTYFDPGTNIIVVWSSGNAKIAADTLWDSVYVKTVLGVRNIDLNSSLSVYPTLAKDHITVELHADAPDKMFLPEIIKVRDVFGRRVYGVETVRSGKNKIQVNISALSSGIYFLDISLPSQQRMTAKFIRQ